MIFILVVNIEPMTHTIYNFANKLHSTAQTKYRLVYYCTYSIPLKSLFAISTLCSFSLNLLHALSHLNVKNQTCLFVEGHVFRCALRSCTSLYVTFWK